MAMTAVRRVASLVRKDARLLVRNYYLVAVLVIAALYIAAVRFLFPADININPGLVLWDNTAGGAVRGAFAAGGDQVIVVETEAEYNAALAGGATRIGIRADGGVRVERFELTFQGYENPQQRRLLGAAMQRLAATLRGEGAQYPRFETRVLRPGQPLQRPPFNLAMVPVLVFTEATMVGMFLAAALLYSEKEERTLRAYRTSPAGMAEYLLARGIAMGLLALVSAVPITLLTIGPAANWLVIVPLVFFAGLVITMLVMVLANLFDTISQFIYPAIALMTVLALPSASYYMPAFGPAWIRLLPTYPLVFALREAYFPTGNHAAQTGAIWQLLLTLAVVFPLAVVTFRRQLIARDV
jgi:hypothetical protein